MVYIDTLMAASDPFVRTLYFCLGRQPAPGGKGLAWNVLLQAETIAGLEPDVVGSIVDCRPTRRPSAQGRDTR